MSDDLIKKLRKAVEIQEKLKRWAMMEETIEAKLGGLLICDRVIKGLSIFTSYSVYEEDDSFWENRLYMVRN